MENMSDNNDAKMMKDVNGSLDPDAAMRQALNVSRTTSSSEEEHRARTEGKPLCRYEIIYPLLINNHTHTHTHTHIYIYIYIGFILHHMDV